MRLTRIFLLTALLLATGTTASAKKPIPIERYQKNIMRIVKQQPFYNPAHEYVFMYLPFKKSREILTSIFKQGKTCWNIRYAYFQMLTTRTCKWIYGCMMPTV